MALAAGIAARLSAVAPDRTEPSLYDGLGGDVTALKLLAPGREQAALARLADLMTPRGWNTTLQIEPGSVAPVTDLVLGSAGVVLAAIWAGGEHARGIAATGGQALLDAADQTEAGLDWAMLPGWPSRMSNYSHGTAGVAAALAVAGAALDRADFVAAARQGAQHLLAVGSLDSCGFTIPHTLPYSSRDVEPVTYTWCHGPAGTSQLFAALAARGWTRSPGCRWDGCGNDAWTQSLPPVSRSGSGRVSGTTTAAAAAPPGSGTCCWTPRRTAPTRRGPTSCCGQPALWQTPWPGARSATRLGHAGGSSNIAGTRPCCHLVPHGCKAPQGSPPSCSASPASSKPAQPPRSSIARTSGGPSRPSFEPSIQARRFRQNRHSSWPVIRSWASMSVTRLGGAPSSIQTKNPAPADRPSRSCYRHAAAPGPSVRTAGSRRRRTPVSPSR